MLIIGEVALRPDHISAVQNVGGPGSSYCEVQLIGGQTLIVTCSFEELIDMIETPEESLDRLIDNAFKETISD